MNSDGVLYTVYWISALKAMTNQTVRCWCYIIWNNEDVQINLHNCCLIAAAKGDKAAAAPAGKCPHNI